MGFENRKSVRVKLEAQIYVWPSAVAEGPGIWGRTINLSATGLAFHCATALNKGETLLIELSLPDSSAPIRLTATVVFREAAQDGFQVRLNFIEIDSEARHLIRLYVLQVAEPGVGWGRAYFPSQQAIDVKYRELSATDRTQWLAERQYLSMKEIAYVKLFQLALEQSLGLKVPDTLKLVGSRMIKEQADVWMELDLGHGTLHFLARVLWCRQEKGQKAELGLSLTAFHKDEAMKLEKGG